MSAADKIAEARALIGFANRMSYVALRVGLEGTDEWDQVAGAADIYRVQDAVAALADLADAQAQEIARLKAALERIASHNVPADDRFNGKLCGHGRSMDEDCNLCTAVYARAVLGDAT